ncbi:DUF2092 domain-containing protein [Variovorax saccharolyticus]|uniref:DUF2092 domain-containing protein n=1 Tax=Variovorax saccharolyticus TaxID=3053516 RepID=UPI0025749A81|nr:DUF2092 domain-containing protein [Variovorax sp. J31P216]MDM0028220.1 DUF2092 domain-containing protein [Variovorax sp. J31P216]
MPCARRGHLLATGVAAPTTAPAKRARTAKAQAKPPQLEVPAMDLLHAMSASLTGAKSLAFTAVTPCKRPSRVGPPLAYATISEVVLQRPDRLRVVTLGNGPALEFHHGRTVD